MKKTSMSMTALIAVHHQPLFAASDASLGLPTSALDFDANMTLAPSSDHTLGAPVAGSLTDPMHAVARRDYNEADYGVPTAKTGMVHQSAGETGQGVAQIAGEDSVVNGKQPVDSDAQKCGPIGGKFAQMTHGAIS